MSANIPKNRTAILNLAILGIMFAPSPATLGQDNPCGVSESELQRAAAIRGEDEEIPLLMFLGRGDDCVFYYEGRLRPALRSLLGDQKVNGAIANILTLIGEPEDLQSIIQYPPEPQGGGVVFPNRWAYFVVCSLLDPTSEEDWSFLRKCAINEFKDRWVDQGAIQTLRLIASPRSQGILEEAMSLNPFRAKEIERAMTYIQSDPTPLMGPKLEELADRVAGGMKIGNWKGNGMPRYNESGQKALVDFTFQSGTEAFMDTYIYTATFHKNGDVWKLKGVRETSQSVGAVVRGNIVR